MDMAKKKQPQQRERPEMDGRLNLVEEQEEIARWDKFAEERGLSLSAWVRMTLRAAVRKQEVS